MNQINMELRQKKQGADSEEENNKIVTFPARRQMNKEPERPSS